jgi:excisionase family DNA binding protein
MTSRIRETRGVQIGAQSVQNDYDSSRLSRSVVDKMRLPPAIDEMPLLTARAAAERMGIGYSTLKQWIHQGKIRTTQTVGGHHRLSETEIARLLARRTPSGQAASRQARRPTGLILALSGRNRLRGFVEEVRIDGRAEPSPGRRCAGDHQVHRCHGGARGGRPSARPWTETCQVNLTRYNQSGRVYNR